MLKLGGRVWSCLYLKILHIFISFSFIYFNQASIGMADGHKIPVGTKVQAVYSEDGEWYTFLSCFCGFLLLLKNDAYFIYQFRFFVFHLLCQYSFYCFSLIRVWFSWICRYDATIEAYTPNGYLVAYNGWGNKEEVRFVWIQLWTARQDALYYLIVSKSQWTKNIRFLHSFVYMML